MPLIAAILCIAAILGLFALDREPEVRTSPALWIPTVWILINGSRSVSAWLHPNQVESAMQRFTAGSPLDAAVYALLIVAGIVVLNFRTSLSGQILRQNIPLILFFAYCLLSVMWSDDSMIAFKRWGKAMGDMVMVLIMLTDPAPVYAIKRVFKRATFILLPLSVLLIYFYPSMGTAFDPQDRVTMFVGVTTFKNLLGMLLLVCGISSLWSFQWAYEDERMPRRRQHMLAHGLMILVAIWLLLKCDSMTAFSCFLLSAAVMVLSTQRWTLRRPGRIHLLVATSLILPLFALFIDSAMLHMLHRQSNLTDRISIWHAVLAMHTNPFIGTGFESFWLGDRLQSVWDLSVRGIAEAHNGYLEIYINLGWIGLLLLFAMMVSAYPKIIRSLQRTPFLGRLALGYFVAGLIYNLTEAGFRMMSPIWIAFLLGITCTFLAVDRQQNTQPARVQLNQKAAAGKMRILQ